MTRRSDPPTSRHGRRRSSSSRGHQAAPGEEHHQSANYVLSSVSEYQHMYAEDHQPRNGGLVDMNAYNDGAQGQGSSGNHGYHDGLTYDDGQYAYDNDDTMSMIPQNGSSESIDSGFQQTQDPIQQQLARLADDAAADKPCGQPARARAPHPRRKDRGKAAQKFIEDFDDKWVGKNSRSSSSRCKSSVKNGSKKGSSSSGQRR